MVTRVNRPARGRVCAREAARRALRASVQPPHPPAGFRRWLKFISDAHRPHFFSEGRHVHRSGCTNEIPQSRPVRGRIMISASIHGGTEMLSPFALAFLPRTVPPPRGVLHIGGGGRRAARRGAILALVHTLVLPTSTSPRPHGSIHVPTSHPSGTSAPPPTAIPIARHH
jgi:hypothetical protein